MILINHLVTPDEIVQAQEEHHQHNLEAVTPADESWEMLLREAARAAFEQQASTGHNFEVGMTRIIEDWALVSFRIHTSEAAAGLPEWDTRIGLARWDGLGWAVVIEGAAEFVAWLEQAPEELIPAGARPYLNPDVSIASDAPGLWLPFPVGQTWKYLAGPHGSLGREAVDFGPFRLNELTTPNPAPTAPLTGRERDVTAAATGIVVDRDANLLILRHSSHPVWETGYFALAAASNTSQLGQLVFQGQYIGSASSEGTQRQEDHLHFWVRRGGVDQSITGQTLSDWQIFQDNGYAVGQDAGRIVYRDGDERVDCETVALANLPKARCHIHHFTTVADPLAPLSLTIQPTETITVALGDIDSSRIVVAGNSDLYKVYLRVSYAPVDPVVVIDAFPGTPGIQVEPGGVFDNQPFTVIQNQVLPDMGLIEFEAELQPPAPAFNGTDSLIDITWLRQAMGDVTVEIDEIRLTDLNDRFIPIDPAPDPVVIKQGFVLAGEVSLQGRDNWSGVTIAADGRDVQTEADGRFSFGLAGAESLLLTAPGYLDATTEVDLSRQPDGKQLDLGRIELLAGDMNQDSTINIFDLAYIAARYDTVDSRADLNQDGIVNILDLTLAAANYDRQGPLVFSLDQSQASNR